MLLPFHRPSRRNHVHAVTRLLASAAQHTSSVSCIATSKTLDAPDGTVTLRSLCLTPLSVRKRSFGTKPSSDMANGTWRNRLRRFRDRVLRRQEAPTLEVVQPLIPNPTPSELQAPRPAAAAPRNPPALQRGAIRPAYFYLPSRVHENLPNPPQPAAPFDVSLPVPTSGLSPRPVIGPQPSAIPASRPTWQPTAPLNQAGTPLPPTATNPSRTGASTSTPPRAHMPPQAAVTVPGRASPPRSMPDSTRGRGRRGGPAGRPRISFPSVPHGFTGPNVPASQPPPAAAPPFKECCRACKVSGGSEGGGGDDGGDDDRGRGGGGKEGWFWGEEEDLDSCGEKGLGVVGGRCSGWRRWFSMWRLSTSRCARGAWGLGRWTPTLSSAFG
jgi:hypothetical protein